MTARPKPHSRITAYRRKLRASGLTRLELSVPARDAGLIRNIATTIRAGGERAEALRRAVAPVVKPAGPAKTGRELLELLREAGRLLGDDELKSTDAKPSRPPRL